MSIQAGGASVSTSSVYIVDFALRACVVYI